jgi:hypothetical protein
MKPPNPPVPAVCASEATGAAVGLRSWLTGMRPVAGAIAACSVLLLGCSLFGLGPGDFGARRGVAMPAPVRVHGSAIAGRAGARERGDIVVARDVARDTRALPPTAGAAATRDVRHHRNGRGVRTRTGRSSATPAPTSSTASTPSPATSVRDETTQTAASQSEPTLDVGTNLPTPLDEVPVPTVTTPPLPVTVPTLLVPDPPVQTATVGLP